MNIKIPYKNNFQNLSLSDDTSVSVIHPNNVEMNDESECISQAINEPLGGEPFAQFIAGVNKILIIINDGTRPTPTEKVIDSIYDSIHPRKIYFLIATGTHRDPTMPELQKMLGKYYKKYKNNIVVHDAENNDMVKAGITNQGTEVYYNKIVYDFNRIISVNSVEPHYFAGFTGGRKSFFPGVAHFHSTEMNHKLALDSHSKILKLQGNPVHEDMQQAVRLLDTKKIFSIQTVLNREEKIYFTAAGNIEESFNAAVDRCMDVYSVPMQEKADIVIAAVTPPMDINLYQSHKAMQHARLALKPGGIIILVSPCLEGMGNEVFSQVLRSYETKEQLLKYAEKNFKLGTQTAVKFTELSSQARLWGVTDIEPNIIRSVFMSPFISLQKAVNEALIQKPNGNILVLMNATLTVPIQADSS